MTPIQSTLAVFFLTLIFGVIAYLFKGRIERIEADIKAVAQENQSIKTNYTVKFDMLKDSMHDLKVEIIESINRLKEQLNEKFVTHSECDKIHQ